MRDVVVAIDAGTTGITVQAVDRRVGVVAKEYSEFPQYYPRPGWVEHDATEIRDVAVRLLRRVVRRAGPVRIAAIGITNQRETTVLWDRRSGRPVGRAIVWQCRRTAEMCARLKRQEPWVRRRTGLVLDPYFSGTKVRWLMEEVPGLARRARDGRIAFGTVDAWLIWCLTGGRVHATDPTNASRTLLFDIERRRWDPDLMRLFRAPEAILPQVRDSAGDFGRTAKSVAGVEVPIAGVAGDQQAAMVGHGCVGPGTSKNTYGTGCFILLHTGGRLVRSRHGLITTLTPDARGRPAYALEGSVFIAGAAIQWLRDGLGIVARAADTERLARSLRSNDGVYLVPAFVGLGAPHWDAQARGVLCGLTRGTTRAHLARAALEAIAHQTCDVVDALEADARVRPKALRVDGGAVANDFLMQFQADVLGVPVVRPRNIETTSLGAAFLAGLAAGVWGSIAEAARRVGVDRTFRPRMDARERRRLRAEWARAVARARG